MSASDGSGSAPLSPTLEEVHRTKSRRIRRHESSTSSSQASTAESASETSPVLTPSELPSAPLSPTPAAATATATATTPAKHVGAIGYQKNATIARLLARSKKGGEQASTFRVHFASGKIVAVTFAPRTRLAFVLEAVGAGEQAGLDTHDAFFLDGRHIDNVNATIDTLDTQDVRFVEREEGADNWRCAVCCKVLPRRRFVWKTGHACFCDKCYVRVLERRLEAEYGLEGAANEMSVSESDNEAVPVPEDEDEGEIEAKAAFVENGQRHEENEVNGEHRSDGQAAVATDERGNGQHQDPAVGADGQTHASPDKDRKTRKGKGKGKGTDASEAPRVPDELDEAITQAVASVATPRPPRHSLAEFPDGLVERIIAAHHFERSVVEANVDAFYYCCRSVYPSRFASVKDDKEEHYEVEDDKDASGESASGKEARVERTASKCKAPLKVPRKERRGERVTAGSRGERDGMKVSVRYVPPDVLEAGRAFVTDVKDVKKFYRIEQESGQGGFGSVFLAKDHKRKTRVAVKRLTHVTDKNKETNYGEIGFLALSKHPNIVQILDAHIRHGTTKKPDEAWIVLEFLHGGTLKRAAQAHKFSTSHIAFVAREILRGLAYLHARGWVHRDIKSANIMIDARGLIKLIDFGLATEVVHAGPRMGMAGSRYWLAPEIVLRQPHARPVDVWATGVCLLEMFAGKPPYYPHTLRCMFHSATRGLMDKVPSEVAPECRDFFSKVFVIDPARRATVDELLQHKWLTHDDLGQGIQDVFKAVFFSNALSDMMGYL